MTDKEIIKKLAFHLTWMLEEMDFRNEQTGIGGIEGSGSPDSPEVKEIRELLESLK